MTRDEAIERIKEGLQFRRDLDEPIKRRLEEARLEREQGKTLPWFLKEEDAVLDLLQSTDFVDLPTGFIRTATFERLRYSPIDSDYPVNIPWKSLDDALTTYGAFTDYGGPQVAVLRASTIKFFPVADLDYSLTWTYYKHSEPLNAGDVAEHPWLVNAPDVIIGNAGMRMALDIKNPDAAKTFSQLEARGVAALFSEIIVREEAGGHYIMGANN